MIPPRRYLVLSLSLPKVARGTRRATANSAVSFALTCWCVVVPPINRHYSVSVNRIELDVSNLALCRSGDRGTVITCSRSVRSGNPQVAYDATRRCHNLAPRVRDFLVIRTFIRSTSGLYPCPEGGYHSMRCAKQNFNLQSTST
jgi:hypothetical protein